MSKNILLFLSISCSTWSASQVEGQQVLAAPLDKSIYVDARAGSDASGTGSITQPYQSLTRALESVSPVNGWDGDFLSLDADGDGDLDLLRTNGNVGAYWEHVSGSNGSRLEYRGTAQGNAFYPERVYFPGDLDHDGLGDLIALDFSVGSILGLFWLRNQGGLPPRFQYMGYLPCNIPGGVIPHYYREAARIAVGDINGDGLCDIAQWRVVTTSYPGCRGFRYIHELAAYLNIGTAQAPSFVEIPLQIAGGATLTVPCAGQSSLVLADVDADGDDDLLYCDGIQIYCYPQLAPYSFGASYAISAQPLGSSLGIAIRSVVKEHGSNRCLLRLVSPDAAVTFAPNQLTWTSFLEAELLLRNGRVELGPVHTLTATGFPGAPRPRTIKLGPGRYTGPLHQEFSWNIGGGVEIQGSGMEQTVIDGLGGPVFYSLNDSRWVPFVAQQNLHRLRLSDLTIENASRGLTLWQESEAELNRVRFSRCQAGIHVGYLSNSLAAWARWGPEVHPLVLRDCEFIQCDTAMFYQSDDHSEHRYERCLFEGNRVALKNFGFGRFRMNACTFVGQTGVAIDFSAAGGCATNCQPLWERSALDLVACHFVDNAEHCRIVSASSAASNARVAITHCSFRNGGGAITTSPQGVEVAPIAVANSLLWNTTSPGAGSFQNLDIRSSSLTDPRFLGQYGNAALAPDDVVDARFGRQSPLSPLRQRGDPAQSRSLGRDRDGQSFERDGAPDMGSDEVVVPSLVGERRLRPGTQHAFAVLGEANALALLAIGFLDHRLLATPSNAWEIDPLAPATVLLGIRLDARGVGALPLPVPALLALPLEGLALQALVFDASAASASITPPLLIEMR